MNHNALREVSNLSGGVGDAKQRLAQRATTNIEPYRHLYPQSNASGVSRHSSGNFLALRPSLYNSVTGTTKETLASPQADRHRSNNPVYCSDVVKEITAMYIEKERQALYGQVLASPRYLAFQPEINEKMRMILVDWLIDVHLKFKLHPETLYLTVNIIDRYLSAVNTNRTPGQFVARTKLQLLGITGILIAAKYEEIWPPEVKECVYICANTYTREEVIRMERDICSVLSFRFTVPTPFPFVVRLLDVLEGLEGQQRELSDTDRTTYMTQLRHTTFFFLDHAILDYKCLQFTPSPTKYQSVRRKYSSTKYGEVAKLMLPTEVPDH
uniref:Cyclin 6 n=1 Tax=Trypanosoma vivax (strain Y486) TaxID=1055687 RepID=G0U9K1_TRYVY